MYIDTHCHVLDPRFDQDRDGVIERAHKNGVSVLIEVGWEEAQWGNTVRFAGENPRTHCVLGIHPHEANKASDEAFKTLEELSSLEKVVGIGETGLDYYYEHSPRNVQQEAFKRHIALARKSGKTLVIHCRDAYEDLFKILDDEFKARGALKGVVHCFSGSLEDARRLVSMGYFLGINGPVTYPKATKLKETVREISLERLLLETDCPYLPPQEYRGKRNEPSYIPLIAEAIANIKGIAIETVAKATTENAATLFGIRN